MSQRTTGPASEPVRETVHEPRPAGPEPSAEQLAAVTMSEERFAPSTDGLQICFQTFGEALEVADAEMPPSFEWPDFKEGVSHFLEKRPPRFADI